MDKIYKKILCPTDFSSYSAQALKKAVSLIPLFDAELLVAHIITDIYSKIYAGNDDVKSLPFSEILKRGLKKVNEFLAEHAPDVPFTTWVKFNEHAYRGIIECAEEKNVDLIVMGTHGRTGPKRILLGSVAENVVRRAPCSTLVVRDRIQ